MPAPLAEEDYDAIESAVMETRRGRWFLAEFARRNRNSDTVILLDAIRKLERAMERPAAGLEPEQVRFGLMFDGTGCPAGAEEAALPAPVPVEPAEAETRGTGGEAARPDPWDESGLWIIDDEPQEPRDGEAACGEAAPRFPPDGAVEPAGGHALSSSDIDGLGQDEKTALFT